MNINPKEIFAEYKEALAIKEKIGNKGIDEQSEINERFYAGDQWYGVGHTLDRPLVRHNIIKRIGDYKMSQIVANPFKVKYSVRGNRKLERTEILDDCYNAAAERMGFETLYCGALKNAYISGSGIIYTYWDPSVTTGVFMGDKADIEIKGDIKSEVIRIEDVFFADPYQATVESQPFIIISSFRNAEDVKKEAMLFGADARDIHSIKGDSSGKVQLLTKFYKNTGKSGEQTVWCVKVCEKATVRPAFDTRLHLYPINLFRWEERNNLIYGDTEASFLIPNQIAINRMITASVWSSVTMGMPIMVVNGDTVTSPITNEPGQIIKIYGSNEDVKGAVSYVAPPDCVSNFGSAAQSLIDNSLIQSGANEVALGDSRPDNASALENMYNAATLPLKLLKSRFYSFIEDICRVWADFWISHYGERMIKSEKDGRLMYKSFNSEDFDNLYLNVKIDIDAMEPISVDNRIKLLIELYDKGIIDADKLLNNLPISIEGKGGNSR